MRSVIVEIVIEIPDDVDMNNYVDECHFTALDEYRRDILVSVGDPKEAGKPEINILGPQGNAFVIMGVVKNVMKDKGLSEKEIEDVFKDMQSSDYEHLCDVAEKYVTLIGRN